MKRPRIVLADDNPAILESVRQLLAADFDVVATVSDGQAALDADPGLATRGCRPRHLHAAL